MPTVTTRPFRLGGWPSACEISASGSISSSRRSNRPSPRNSWPRSWAVRKPSVSRRCPCGKSQARTGCRRRNGWLRTRGFSAAAGLSRPGPPRLLRDDELTEQERERESELYDELLALRERAQSTGPAASVAREQPAPRASQLDLEHSGRARRSASYVPMRRIPLLTPVTSHLNYSQYARFADLDALLEVFGQVKADNPESWIRILSPASLAADFALNHLIIIGGAAVEKAAPGFTQDVPLPAVQIVPLPTGLPGETHVFRYETEGLEFGSSYTEDGTLTRDIGFIARAPHPIVPDRTVTVVGGITSRGVHGAVLGSY